MKVTDKMVNEALRFKYGTDVAPSKTMKEKMFNLLSVALNHGDTEYQELSADILIMCSRSHKHLDEIDFARGEQLDVRVRLLCAEYVKFHNAVDKILTIARSEWNECN